MNKPIFAIRLVELRNLKTLTQQQVANMIDFSRARLNNYEQGIRQPDIDTTIKLAKFFGVTVDYLLGNDSSISTTQATATKTEPTPTQIPDEYADTIENLKSLSPEEQTELKEYIRYKAEMKKNFKKTV